MTDEKRLIRQVLNGDQDAFAQLVTSYEKQVYNLCLRMAGNPEDAQDLAQEAFLKAWRGLPFYKFESSFSTWLYRLTSNVCIDYLRQQKRRQTVSLTMDEETGPELEIPDSEPTPEEQVLHLEDRKAVADAMERLEDDFRLILTMRVVQNLTYDQIAEIMELKVGTVKSRLARARIKLKMILLENGNIFAVDSSKETERGMRHDM